jgi:hypothetical protein
MTIAWCSLHSSQSIEPSSLFCVQLLRLCSAVSQDKITDCKYDHNRYIARPVLALGEYCLQKTVRAVRKSPLFSFITDLSSDIADHENMIVYVRYWDVDVMEPFTEYLCCVQLLGKDGQTIANTLRVICKVLELRIVDRFVALCADGDPAMLGHIKGCLGDLRTDCDHVLGSHCAAHGHVLATGDTAKAS